VGFVIGVAISVSAKEGLRRVKMEYGDFIIPPSLE
jgi:hypothetical protein